MTKAFQPEQPARLPRDSCHKTDRMKKRGRGTIRSLWPDSYSNYGMRCGAFACDACTIFIQCKSKVSRIDGATRNYSIAG